MWMEGGTNPTDKWLREVNRPRSVGPVLGEGRDWLQDNRRWGSRVCRGATMHNLPAAVSSSPGTQQAGHTVEVGVDPLPSCVLGPRDSSTITLSPITFSFHRNVTILSALRTTWKANAPFKIQNKTWLTRRGQLTKTGNILLQKPPVTTLLEKLMLMFYTSVIVSMLMLKHCCARKLRGQHRVRHNGGLGYILS